MAGLQNGRTAKWLFHPAILQFCHPAILVSVTCAYMRSLRWIIACLVLAALAFTALPYVHGLSFVIRVAEMQGAARKLADLDTMREQERDIAIPTDRGPMRARVYEPRSPHRAALLTSGLHPSG